MIMRSLTISHWFRHLLATLPCRLSCFVSDITLRPAGVFCTRVLVCFQVELSAVRCNAFREVIILLSRFKQDQLVMTALFRISAGLGKLDGNKSKKPSLIIIFRFNGAKTCKKKKKNPNNQIFVKGVPNQNIMFRLFGLKI